MSNNQVVNPNAVSAVDPQPAVMLEPEAIVEQVRLLRSQMEGVTPLTPEQKRVLRSQSKKQSDAMLASAVNVIGALDNVALALGQQPGEVRQLQADWNRWTAVSGELRALLDGVDGANLVRRQRLALIATQAFSIGKQLVRDPANAVLVPHIQEVKRLRSFSRRKKAGESTDSPNASPAAAPANPAPAPAQSTTTKA
jgi:hypothetical protein